VRAVGVPNDYLPIMAASGGVVAAASGIASAVGGAAVEDAAVVTGNNAIDISEDAFEHVIEGHTEAGADTAGNSIFNGDAQDVANLIQNSQTSNGVVQLEYNGNIAYVNNTSDIVGYSSSGQYTTVYTVVTDSSGNLVTAFPGVPVR
jgi:NADPH:quinone reductase-like Zn-dependent oxidoreductase